MCIIIHCVCILCKLFLIHGQLFPMNQKRSSVFEIIYYNLVVLIFQALQVIV